MQSGNDDDEGRDSNSLYMITRAQCLSGGRTKRSTNTQTLVQSIEPGHREEKKKKTQQKTEK